MKLSEEERALIDKAVTDGKVQQIRLGRSGLSSDTASASSMSVAKRVNLYKLKRRNEIILALFRRGASIERIASNYGLSSGRVKYLIELAKKGEKTK